MPAADPKADLSLLIQAMRDAGAIAMGHFQKAPRVWEKADGAGPVTEADLAVDTAMHAKLTAERPEYGWLSEESDDPNGRTHRDTVFIIDPIDGTSTFIDGGRNWGHAIAVAHRGKVTAGVVFMPVLDRLYTAHLGGGAWMNGERLSASTRASADGGRILGRAHSLTPKHWPGGAPAMATELRSPMAYRLACLAEGGFDAMFLPRPLWEWDIAAGTLMAQESGHVVTDTEGAPLAFNAAHPRAPGLLAANPALHADLLARRRPA